MQDTGECLGCRRWFIYDVPREEFESGVLDYVPGWCEECHEKLQALDFQVDEELTD